jgi:hypothetical protein
MFSPALTAGLAATMTLAGATAFAQSTLTINGTLDLAMRQVKNGSLGTMRSEVSGSNSTSKLIVRGTEDLGDGLSAGFFLDATILGDTGGANSPFWDRRSTVSLSHVRFGELRLGRDWAPTHLLWTGIDPFVTLGIASANTFRTVFQSRALGQAFGTTAEAQAQNPTLRVANAVEYFLPANLGGIYGALMVSAGEGGNAAVQGPGVGSVVRLWHRARQRRTAPMDVRERPHDEHVAGRVRAAGPWRRQADLRARQPVGCDVGTRRQRCRFDWRWLRAPVVQTYRAVCTRGACLQPGRGRLLHPRRPSGERGANRAELLRWPEVDRLRVRRPARFLSALEHYEVDSESASRCHRLWSLMRADGRIAFQRGRSHVHPPSTVNSCAVHIRESSEASHNTIAAMSSG